MRVLLSLSTESALRSLSEIVLPPKTPLDPSTIQKAPVEPVPHDFAAGESGYSQQMARVRAWLMEPYAKRVLRFLIGYCAIVSIFVMAVGFDWIGFHLPELVLAGSAAVAAIGLIGFVMGGLVKAKS